MTSTPPEQQEYKNGYEAGMDYANVGYKKGLITGFIRGANTAVVILIALWLLHIFLK